MWEYGISAGSVVLILLAQAVTSLGLAEQAHVKSHDKSFVLAVYGSKMTARYGKGASGGTVENGYSADEITTAVLLAAGILPNLAMVLD